MLFPWLNKGLEYTPPKKREIMPIMKLLAYAQEHWAPYACHMIFVSVAAKVITSYYAYPLAVIATGALLLFYGLKGKYPELTARGTTAADWLLAFAVGVVGIAIWIVPYHFAWKLMLARIPILGNEGIFLSFTYGADIAKESFERAAGGLALVPTALPTPTYDPGTLAGAFKHVFIAFRLCGAVITVPFFEELFTRSFIIRFIDDEYYKRVPVGYYSKVSFLFALAIFVFAHPWWFVAVLWGLLIMGLLYYRRNLLLCVFAHAVSNLILGIYILQTGNYYLW